MHSEYWMKCNLQYVAAVEKHKQQLGLQPLVGSTKQPNLSRQQRASSADVKPPL